MSFALLKDWNMEELGVVLMDMHLVTKVRVMRRVRLRDRPRCIRKHEVILRRILGVILRHDTLY